ncbi:MAG: SMI1/KNR4 family protein [Planctomycetaceae bacterium]|nr:SMI1/KNR4 family protein [Planctomycetaceae bacterium]
MTVLADPTSPASGPVDAADVAAAEVDLGVAFPPDLREFLRTYDRPRPSPAWFRATAPV